MRRVVMRGGSERQVSEAGVKDPGDAAKTTPFVLVAEAARRAGRSASRTGADMVFPPTVGPVEVADRLRHLF